MPSEAEYREQAIHDQRRAERNELLALRAENATLRETNTVCHDLHEEAIETIIALRAENERLGAAHTDALNRGNRLYLENERLRAALEARGPYCAQHGERQPCSQHRWA